MTFDMLNHLKSRHLQLERYPTISFDDDSACFPLYGFARNLIGYQKYRPHESKEKRNYGKYFTHFSPGNYGFWGTETINYRKDIVFLAEGIFKACRIHNMNLPALAVMGNDPSPTIRSQLKLLHRYVIVICDPDKAGEKLKKFGDTFIIPRLPLDDLETPEVNYIIYKKLMEIGL